MSKNDGGPAFPGTYEKIVQEPHHHMAFPQQRFQEGMTLRDWFAGMAIGSILESIGQAVILDSALIDTAAFKAYQVADAMIVARSYTYTEEK